MSKGEKYFNPDRLYRFEAGKLSSRVLIPGEPYELTDVTVDTVHGPAQLHACTFLDCREDPWLKDEVLPVLAWAAERLVPWVRWPAAAALTDAKGAVVTWGGRAHGLTDVIVLQTRWNTH